MGAMSELHIKMQDEVDYCLHCDKLITDGDMLELKYGLFIHASCEIEYYFGVFNNDNRF